jgi:hypothetical protein
VKASTALLLRNYVIAMSYNEQILRFIVLPVVATFYETIICMPVIEANVGKIFLFY